MDPCSNIYSGEPTQKDNYKPTYFVKVPFIINVQLCFLHLDDKRTLNFMATLRPCFSYPETVLHLLSYVRTNRA